MRIINNEDYHYMLQVMKPFCLRPESAPLYEYKGKTEKEYVLYL